MTLACSWSRFFPIPTSEQKIMAPKMQPKPRMKNDPVMSKMVTLVDAPATLKLVQTLSDGQ